MLRTTFWTLTSILVLSLTPAHGADVEGSSFDRLKDRGPGIPTSQFGTYIESGQWMLYTFLEYDKNTSEEYSPAELGVLGLGAAGDQEFFGRSTQEEAVLFLGYGINDKLAFELEAEVYASAELEKSPLDASPVPARLSESGFAGAEAQLRWMWREETARRPAMYSFFEVEFPFQSRKVLIGTQDAEYAIGTGFIRGYRWGTLNGRISVAYDGGDGEIEPGEYALEYLKRLNQRWRFVATLEGEDDEISLIGEAQVKLTPKAILKLNSGFGLTEKASDFAPEVGLLITF